MLLSLTYLLFSSLLFPTTTRKAGLQNDSPRPQLRWGQINTTVFVTVDTPRGDSSLGCAGEDAPPQIDVILEAPDVVKIGMGCGTDVSAAWRSDSFKWELELREDIVIEESRAELGVGRDSGSFFVVLRKQISHRWDRLLFDESLASVTKDWKREDQHIPEEDEVELPKAQNIRRLSLHTLRDIGQDKVVVAAMRYPWCTGCEEKDKAFVKATKVIANKTELSTVVFGTVDLRENKKMARILNVEEHVMQTCNKSKCPLHVFKPDEPLAEPYPLEMQLLYEMDEMAMMSDPMAGAPGHTPKGQTAKPNFEKFERDLSRLMPSAITHLQNVEALANFKRERSNVVLSFGLNETLFRRVARRLRGHASFAIVADPSLLTSVANMTSEDPSAPNAAVELWAAEATPSRTPLSFDINAATSNLDTLEHFVLVNIQPLVQTYSWDLKDKLEAIGLPVAVLWVNNSDVNNTNTTRRAMEAFKSVCDRRRGVNASKHVLCSVQDESYSYYQREYGSHEPYPYPFFGLTKKLGFGEGDRWGYPFKEPVNKTVHGFFSNAKRANKQMGTWIGRVLNGYVPPSHESGTVPVKAGWVRGEVQDIVWKTYQKEINGSTADVLLEVFDDQRKKSHIAVATMRLVASVLKDYSSLKIARIESSQNYIPPAFGRKQFSKETEYYWVPPSINTGEWAPEDPIRYTGGQPATPQKLLRFLKKHSLSHWSLKEALEAADDMDPEVMGQAKAEQREDDRADEEKQEMIKKMMSTLKKEKGLVDVGEMMGLKKAAETINPEKADESKKPKQKKGKPAPAPGAPPLKSPLKSPSDVKLKQAKKAATEAADKKEKQLEERRQKLKRDEERFREAERKEKDKKKKRREADKKRKERKKAQEAEEKARAAKEREKKRKKREEERALLPTTPHFSWSQSNKNIHVSVSVPGLNKSTANVTIVDDRVDIRGQDRSGRWYILDFELREFVVVTNSSWALRYSELNPLQPTPDGVTMSLAKAISHRWDRIAQNHSAVKPFMKRDWSEDDGDLEEEHEDVDLPSGPNVKKVTTAALKTLTEQNMMVMVALRYPWCKDKCNEKDKYFVKTAKGSKEKDHLGSIVFAVVDAREEKYFARKYNATCDDQCKLHIFKQDEPDDPYVVPGKRFSEEIQIDCYKHLLPVVSTIPDKDTFDRVTSAFDTAIVGFFHGNQTEDVWYARFKAVARELRGHALFGAIFGGRAPREFGIERDATPALPRAVATEEDSAVADKAANTNTLDDSTTRPLILLFKPKESRHVEFTGDLTLQKLTHFSRVLSLPLVSTYDFESRQKYQELKVPLGMLWLDSENADREENIWAKEVLQRLAIHFSGHLVFLKLNNTRDALLMRPMGLDPRRVPTFGIAATDEMDSAKFGFDMQAYSVEERRAFWSNTDQAYNRLESFCASYLDGTLEASHESAELPPSYRWHGPGVVHEVVWKTFREAVYRTEHTVLLELYSPFRPQHRTFITVLELVAEALAAHSFLKVARMDTANNYVLPEFGLTDKEKASSFYILPAAPEKHRRPKRFGGRGGRPEALPEKLLRFIHRETRGQVDWDLDERVSWINKESIRRIKRLRAVEKDYEKKMQDEWMQKEMEEFERYKKLGKFDNLNM